VSKVDSIIQVKDLWHVYPDGTTALKGVNLDVPRGEFLAVIGQNGSGKTTLAKHFNGLLKPTKGIVVVDGVDTRKTSTSTLATKVGYTFQNPDHQICCSTVEAEVAFGPRQLDLSEDEIRRRVDKWLNMLGLEGFRNEHPFFLNKAERQRVAVASVLAMEPEVLVVDEPTTGMDWKQSYAALDMLKSLNATGKTVIIITHNMRLVAEYARRVVVMLDGLVLIEGSVEEVFSVLDILNKAFLRPPQVTELAHKLKEFGVPPTVLNVQQMHGILGRFYEGLS